jgi:hypothetical protein
MPNEDHKQLANLITDSANLALNELEKLGASSTPTPTWERERSQMETEIGSDEAARWVEAICTQALKEGAYQLRAMAELLRQGEIRSSLEVIVRAVFERAGQINWLLDSGVDWRVRTRRASLNYTVSLYHFRKATSFLGSTPEMRTELRVERARVKSLLATWFKADVENVNVFIGGEDLSKWFVDGEQYPSLTDFSRFALRSGNVSDTVAVGTYAALSGFAHPSLFFGIGRIGESLNGAQVYEYRDEDINKLVRIAIGCYFESLFRWNGYYCNNDRSRFNKGKQLLGEIETMTT